jgi:hypothetical protein
MKDLQYLWNLQIYASKPLYYKYYLYIMKCDLLILMPSYNNLQLLKIDLNIEKSYTQSPQLVLLNTKVNFDNASSTTSKHQLPHHQYDQWHPLPPYNSHYPPKNPHKFSNYSDGFFIPPKELSNRQ